MIFNLVILFVCYRESSFHSKVPPALFPSSFSSVQTEKGRREITPSPTSRAQEFERTFLKRGQILAADVLSETPLADGWVTVLEPQERILTFPDAVAPAGSSSCPAVTAWLLDGMNRLRYSSKSKFDNLNLSFFCKVSTQFLMTFIKVGAFFNADISPLSCWQSLSPPFHPQLWAAAVFPPTLHPVGFPGDT